LVPLDVGRSGEEGHVRLEAGFIGHVAQQVDEFIPSNYSNALWTANGELVFGVNNFTLVAVDVTPAPYNRPPYTSSGDVGFENCIMTATAP
jgi:hypothetical protein